MKNIKSISIIAIIILSLSISFFIYYYYSLQKPLPSININNKAINTDKFGIKEIYRSKPGGENWYINMNDPNHDPRTDPQTTLIRNDKDYGIDSWKIQNNEVRYNVFTSSGYQPQLITTLNQTELSKKGYMQLPNDWKNVEITGYFKINSFTNSERNGAAHIELVARGGKNTNDNTLINGLSKQCESTTYHSNTYETGRVKFEKDLMHTQGYTTEDKQKPNAIKEPLIGRWIGIKAVFYNLDNNTSVKLEQYIDDKSDNNWHRVLSFVDNGHWGGGTPNCGGSDNQIITWGGPIVIFRWDNIDDMDIKNFSIREIMPN
ncbi:MAG: hypothetical protein ACTHJ2_09830 [Candidatus Nitrosocosmicus sp.]